MNRPLRIVFLVATALWYGVVVPGHTRGIVALPGAEPADNCCSTKAPCATDQTPGAPGESQDKKKSDPVSSCAICQLVTVTPVPTVIHLDVRQLYLLTELSTPRYVHPHVAGQVDARSARDPPSRA